MVERIRGCPHHTCTPHTHSLIPSSLPALSLPQGSLPQPSAWVDIHDSVRPASAMAISATNGNNLPKLLEAIEKTLLALSVRVECVLPYAAGTAHPPTPSHRPHTPHRRPNHTACFSCICASFPRFTPVLPPIHTRLSPIHTALSPSAAGTAHLPHPVHTALALHPAAPFIPPSHLFLRYSHQPPHIHTCLPVIHICLSPNHTSLPHSHTGLSSVHTHFSPIHSLPPPLSHLRRAPCRDAQGRHHLGGELRRRRHPAGRVCPSAAGCAPPEGGAEGSRTTGGGGNWWFVRVMCGRFVSFAGFLTSLGRLRYSSKRRR